jgi:hypothetical protein
LIAERLEHRKNVVKGRRLRGQVLLAQGVLGDAGRELGVARKVAQELGNPPQLWKTLAVIEGVAARLTDIAVGETLLTSEHVRGIRRRVT